MKLGDPIVAIATPRGRSAVGIVRVSGCGLESIVSSIFEPVRKNLRLADRRPHLGHFKDMQGHIIDHGLLIWMKAPATYTGEDILELHAHGNPYILDALVRAVTASGARMAEAGEFTRRAYLNDKIDLLQADAVMHIIQADSEKALRAAHRLLDGELSRAIEALRSHIMKVLAGLELLIDFPEEYKEQGEISDPVQALSDIEGKLGYLLESARRSRRVQEGLRVVICGRPNVGKSSLFNRLAGQNRAIVTDVPGTTRDLLETLIEVKGFAFRLQDTAGVHTTPNPVEREGILRAEDAVRRANLILFVLDAERGVEEEDRRILKRLMETQSPILAVYNKSDRGRIADDALPLEHHHVSAVTGLGLETLLERLGQAAQKDNAGADLVLVSERHAQALEKVHDRIVNARQALEHGLSPEASSMDLYEALEHLDLLGGKTGREDVIDEVFSSFCLGK